MNNLDILIENHWEYVKEVIRDNREEDSSITLTVRDYLTILGYHYKTAFKHGFKHGREKR
jgi:hypothetical protein